MAREGDVDILSELSGRMSPTDLPEQEDRGLAEAIGGEAAAPRPCLPDRRNCLLPVASKEKAE
jgi:hypothetical protein